MNRFLLFVLGALVVTSLVPLSWVQAQTHQVTFILNTATVPDTLPVTGAGIQIRGALVNSGTVSITWNNDTVNNMTNIGGDYWSKTLTLNTDDTLKYKFVIGYVSGTGWEQNTTPPYAGLAADNRYFIVGNSDTT